MCRGTRLVSYMQGLWAQVNWFCQFSYGVLNPSGSPNPSFLFHRIPRSPPYIWLLVSASFPISCWMKPFWWQLAHEYSRMSFHWLLPPFLLVMVGSILDLLAIQAVSGVVSSSWYGSQGDQCLVWLWKWTCHWLATPIISVSPLSPTYLVGRANCRSEVMWQGWGSPLLYWKSCLIIGDGSFKSCILQC